MQLFRYLSLSLALGCIFSVRLLAAGEAVLPDDLLILEEQQTEALDTLDATNETTVMAQGVSRTLKTRLLLDKPQGRIKMQYFDTDGTLRAEMIVEGTKVYAHDPKADLWKTMPMDEQNQKVLESLGVDFSPTAKGLAGLEKTDGAAVEAADAPAPTPSRRSGHGGPCC